jgi:hypothetical protein
MAELTEAMHDVMNHCSAQTLATLRQHFPDDADSLYTTLALRNFLDVLRDNASGDRLATLIAAFNAAVEAPVKMRREVQ